jgi:hypothetical protein
MTLRLDEQSLELPIAETWRPLCTLNPLFPPSPTCVLGYDAYSHPVLSADSVRADRLLAWLNEQAATSATGPDSRRHRAFAGAWSRYGFHEDGFVSGLLTTVAPPGVAQPFSIKDADMEREVPFVVAMAWSFDVLEVVHAFAALLVGKALFIVVTVIGPIKQKRCVLIGTMVVLVRLTLIHCLRGA